MADVQDVRQAPPRDRLCHLPGGRDHHGAAGAGRRQHRYPARFLRVRRRGLRTAGDAGQGGAGRTRRPRRPVHQPDREPGPAVPRGRRRSLDPGWHRDHDRAAPDHRARSVPDHHLGGDRAGHRHRAVRRTGLVRAQPPAGPRPRVARVRHAGTGLHHHARSEHRARPRLQCPAARARRRPELGHLGHPDLPVPRDRGHARVLPAGRQLDARGRRPVRRISADPAG
jgi:hypothetical protein